MTRNLLRLAALAGAAALLVAASNNWSPSTPISPLCQPDPTRGAQLNDIAVNANGLAVAAWDQYTYTSVGPYTIGVAVQSGAKWSAPFTISGTTGFSSNPKVAVGADGTMAVSWVYQDPALTQRRAQVAVKWPAAPTWTTTTLSAGPVGDFVPLGIDVTGTITAAWTLWDGTRHTIQTATLPKGGVWSPATGISKSTSDALYFSLSVNERGNAGVLYTTSPYTSYLTGTWAEYVSRSGPNGTWTSPVTVSETLPSTVGYVAGPQVALDATGLATAVYFAYGVEATRQTGPTTWSTPKTVLQAANQVSSYFSPDLAVDRTGNALLATSIFDATIGVDRAAVWVTKGSPTGTWTTQQRLTDPAANVDAYATRVALSPDGTLAMVGWIDHYHGVVQVSTFSNGAWGAGTTIGKNTAFSSFQEVLGLKAAAGNVARAIWKSAKSGTQTIAASYGK
jgi:hypothetical protein